ncbi:DEAD/DEAH box helicase [Clostridium sp. CM028]|uniref:DEAD/DEAH box helicase n=1 Tax=unclassified Clostridium TaxID=2614128 RepID=UPI001C6E488C|nr:MULTISPECIES: DEAD/DEAH box helicase [unclassified Clostridium]MBW9146911.1 DEAD/DEAH box helicase [Clostridium sp. CM027]MBW9148065.1 DEAD/DEAH box helicase [Clostridium sp. CM028]UVE40823.1 DEAD/DEAH box helicase [Clostridium sp. CM027]WLC61488.1 DEAD/DEAH box helicase [Clostridium sp. CM028]
MIKLFNELGLQENLIEGLIKQGIQSPTEIQVKAIPIGLEGKDIIGESETGSGKTLAYLLPIFQKIDTTSKDIQAIVLAPTHELAMQIHKQIELLSENSNSNIKSTTIIGNVNIKRQLEALKEKPHIIVGSAGRILELITMKKLKSHFVKTIVIDEGDRMIDEDNIDGVKAIIKTTLRDRQIMIFSATISLKVVEIAKTLMKDPEVIKVGDKSQVNPNIEHMYFVVEKREKLVLLRKLISATKPEKAIIFINKSDEVEITTSKLGYHGLKVEGIHGSSDKLNRKKAIEDFNAGKIQLLVASDLAARGLDIVGVSHIFNLDIPENPKDYLHRVGRTARMGEHGFALSITEERELDLIKNYEKDFNIEILPKDIRMGTIIDLQNTPKAKSIEHNFRSDSKASNTNKSNKTR